MMIRGEIIMSKSVFNNYYAHECANSRNLVAGIVNQKHDPTIKQDGERNRYNDIDFIAYSVYYPVDLPFEQQMGMMINVGVRLPFFQQYTGNHWKHELISLLKMIKENYEYEIDGLIVCESKGVHKEMYDREKRENPRWAFAYKNHDIVETKRNSC